MSTPCSLTRQSRYEANSVGTAADGSGRGENTEDGADLALDVARLDSLLLGTVRPSARARLARLAGGQKRMDRLFEPVATPYCISFF